MGQLPHISLSSATDWYPNALNKDEWDNLQHFSPTSAADRDLTTLGRELDDDAAWCNALTDETVQANEVDYVFRRPTFGWLPADIIRETFQCMTQ